MVQFSNERKSCVVCKNETGPTIFQALLQFLSLTPAIKRYRYGAYHDDRDEGDQPFGAVTHGDGNTVTLGDRLLLR